MAGCRDTGAGYAAELFGVKVELVLQMQNLQNSAEPLQNSPDGHFRCTIVFLGSLDSGAPAALDGLKFFRNKSQYLENYKYVMCWQPGLLPIAAV